MNNSDIEHSVSDALHGADELWPAPPGLAERILGRGPATAHEVRLEIVSLSRRRQRRWTSGLLSAAVVLAVVLAVGFTLAQRKQRPNAPAPERVATSRSPEPPAPLRAPGQVTAAELHSYRWSALPAAPITVRDGAASAWTGKEMLVWGGYTDDKKTFADGAAFNPATRTWRVLPRSPLSARTGVTSVWTGRQWFLWGGSAFGSNAVIGDGAEYNPTTDTWSLLSSPHLPAAIQTIAVWTGQTIQLLSLSSAGHGQTLSTVDWDPTTNGWTRLAELSVAPGVTLDNTWMTAVTSGPDTFVWIMTDGSIGPAASSGYEHSAHLYQLHSGRDSWNRVHSWNQSNAVFTAVWDGNDTFIPTVSTCWGPVSCPLTLHSNGLSVSPGGNTRAIPQGPAGGSFWKWTGRALLGYDDGSYTSGASISERPGDAVAWDPDTQKWTRLATAPHYLPDPSSVWTGTSLLMWGTTLDGPNNTTGAIGLELAK